ncbi:MAG: carbohydrate kinase family protein [Clostridiales bacterium]|nr:carbohydrate kinase family protein [Clostridiales bacterium]
MPARTKVIVAGCVCIDISPEFRGGRVADIGELLRPGKLIETGKATISPGGAVSNTGLALKALGEDVVLMARIGNDLLGDTLSGIMAKYGVEDSMIRAPGEDTAYSVVLAIPGIDRIFLHDPGANHTFCADDIPQDGLEDAAIFHFGYPPLMRTMFRDGGDELIKVMSKAKAAGCITSLDMAMADPESEAGQADWPSILKKALPLTDIFVPSFEELLFMLDRSRYDALKAEAGKDDITEILDLDRDIRPLADKSMAMGVKVLLLKCGVPGLYLRTADKESLTAISEMTGIDASKWSGCDAFERSYVTEKVVSASGAGDTSIAGFLAGILHGESPEDCLHIAAAAGALSVTEYDAVSAILPLADIKAKIEAGWDKIG